MQFLLAALLLFLSGCLSMSDSDKKENLAVSPSLDKSQKEGIDSDVFASGSWPDKEWWAFFDSPVLSKWISDAFAKNPSLQSLEYSIEQARQVAVVSRSKLMPTLYFDARDNYAYFSQHELDHLYNPSLPIHGYEVDLSLAFNYEFDFWNKNRNMFRAAVGELKAKTAEYYQAELIVSTSLAQSFFALLTTIQKKELYQDLVAVRKKRLDLQIKMQEGAIFDAFPPLLGDEGVRQAEQQVAQMDDEIRLETHQINILMGRGPDEDLCLENITQNPPTQIPLPKDLSSNLLARRPDLMAQIWRAEAMALEVSAAKADFFPNINLAAFGGFKSVAWSNLFQNSSHTVGYSPAISLPIFTAGAIKANVRTKKAAFDKAIFEYNNLLLVSAQEVADALSQVRTVYKQKDLQTGVVLDAAKRLELTLLRVEGRLDSEFAVLDFEEALIDKKIKEVDFTYLQYAFVVKLMKSLGGGYLSSDVPISKGAQ